ncbi:RP198 family tick cell line-upregulated protein [Candidatus Tisiphia endosymbiont of Ceraclea dissimilis]|uniref:RP198 family tick cell line-upregulated protein n=1 Tax=Candidatus Tisiphia endosymbiont of Ceraclea dissimilis TaxID=3077928 RepID=UPI003CCB49CF
MIRKILLFICLTYTIIWFAVAYTIKSNVVSTINNSEIDNIKISYSQVKVSGFPYRLQISLVEPKIKFIDHINSKEISAEKMIFLFDFSFKKANLILGQTIKQQENFGGKLIEYSVQSKEDIAALVKFNKPIYRLSSGDNLKSIVKLLQVNNKLLSIIQKDKEIFNISDLVFLINKAKSQDGEDIALQLRLSYAAKEDFLNFKTAQLDLATLINIATDQDIRNLNIDRLVFSCDDNAQIALIGFLQFFESNLPKGKLSFELTNHHDIIDKLIPNNLLLPKKMIKAIIEKVANSSVSEVVKTDDSEVATYEKVKFDIEFSDNGIHIGSINLLEFKLEDSKVNADEPLESNNTDTWQKEIPEN